MQRDTEYNVPPARQPGDLAAAQQAVASMQSEALYVSFLLTGDRQAAVALAETGFLQLFDQTGSSEIDTDRRTQILLIIGKSFLRGDYKERVERDLPAGLFADPAPARFGVDTRRTLLLAALGRLSDRERLALVLNDLSGLDSTTLNALLERRNEPLVAPMETARQRVRQSVDLPQGEPLRPALVEAAFDAPKINLWPRLEEPLAEIQRKHKQQSQLITYGVVGLVAIVLLAGIVYLFGGALLDGGDAAGTSSGSSASQEMTALPADPTPDLAPPVFAPASTPEPSGPAANVPGWFLAETMHGSTDGSNDYYRSLARYDPEQNEIQNLFVNEIRLADSLFPVQFSPGGDQMTLFRENPVDLQSTYYIDSFGTDIDGRQWETELLTMDRDPNSNPGFNALPRLAAAHTEDRVYVAVMTTGTEPTLTVHELFHRNGKSRGIVEIDLPEQTVDTRTFQGNIYLYAPEGGDSVYLVLETFGDSSDAWRATLYTIDRAGLTVADSEVVTADSNQEFWFWEARPTVDGQALYGLRHRPDGSPSQVQFLDLETGDLTAIELPFPAAPNYQFSTMTNVLSHDGRRMYVIDPMGASVAIINLAEQRLERLFPLDSGEFESRFGTNPSQYLFGFTAILSANGSKIYVAAISQNPFRDDTRWEAGIWVLDATTWSIIDLIPVEGFVEAIHLVPEELAILVQTRVPVYEGQKIEMVKLSMEGSPEIVDRIQLPVNDSNPYSLRSPADLFRLQYSRSPAIAGTQFTDSQTSSTLPRMELTAAPDIVAAGQQASIEVRILDPASGEPVTGEREDVRFDPLSGVTAIVASPDGERQFLVLGQVEPGVYRGSVTVPTTGLWTVDVAVSDVEGETWVASDAGQIDVVPTFIGSDGRAYLFQLSFEPEQPIYEQDTTVRLRLVDAETREPMPETTTVAIARDALDNDTISDLPDRIDVRLSQGQGGAQKAILNQIANGSYEGTIRYWVAGRQLAEILLQPLGQSLMTIPAGTVVVGVE